MKKYLFKTACIAAAITVIGACTEDLNSSDCKSCKRNIYNANQSIIEEGEAIEYCGDELQDVQNFEPTTVDGKTTKYDCH